MHKPPDFSGGFFRCGHPSWRPLHAASGFANSMLA